MKLFTISDFLTYNAPCFNCGQFTNIDIGFCNTSFRPTVFSSIRPYISKNATEITFSIKYAGSMKMSLQHKTNKIEITDIEGLTKYLLGHKLFLISTCKPCFCRIESEYLDFDLQKGLVKPVGLCSETLGITDTKHEYSLSTNFEMDISYLSVYTKDSSADPIKLELPLTPKYRFKNKYELLKKLRTYALFS